MSISQLLAVSSSVVLLISTLVLLIICLFFLVECTAALLPIASWHRTHQWQDTQVTVLVPAHNEEVVIRSTLEKLMPALKAQDRLIVIADNCSDATAEIARSLGATVIERHDSICKGKGYALDYGLRFIEFEPPDVVVIIDADCTVYPGAIAQLSECAIATNRPVQATYLMLRQKNSQSSKDLVSQFSIIIKNLVRPLGSTRLGMPCLLYGTGMAFPWSVIRSVNLASGHIVEDLKLGLDLTIAGHKPLFCLEAKVTGYLPQQLQAAKTQRTRWEHGHLQIMQTYVPLLLQEAVNQKRLDLLASALDLCVPPLSLLVMIWSVLMTCSLLFGVLTGVWIPVIMVICSGLCVLMSIFIAWSKFAYQDLPLHELLTIPFYIFWKIPVYFNFLVQPQSLWIRTERDKVS
ncbi:MULTISPECIES: glycosyltransferase family 2 protein [Fischerella]|uniref:Glycosyl transferase n=1 Tax=Fischerella muscicola CCMEE 5323 TaxID=2019572 RepID=A0A2N6K7M3_FISMU|nr:MULTISPECIES: glycosyltransferase family 2 protein [Fischerella]MBD2430897.1 glycosyltransferase family 2 protein [Fischerella sp. FACHB-380]PLZ93334.1 glycosyl transferase [Fischerella muscicola CCMEE 5323]